jgi:NADPH:quinone reductase-like Zn-dependent oxidoreductase
MAQQIKNVVLVHGAFADGSGWAPVASILKNDGYKVSVAQPPETSYADDQTINVVRRPELIPELEAIGGDLVVVDEDDAIDKIRATVGKDRVQLAIDGVSGKSSALIASALTADGAFVDYAYMGGGLVTINPFELIVKRVVAKGFFMNHSDIEPKIPAALREAVPLVAVGAIRVPIAATYPLSSLREAVLHAERGGKVLLDLRGTA